MKASHRAIAGFGSIVALLCAGGGYVTWAIAENQGPAASTVPAAAPPGSLLFLDGGRDLAQVPVGRAGARPVHRGLACLRSYTARGTTICLRPVAMPAGFEAVFLRGGKRLAEPVRIDGTPSRARVSASGRLTAWTVFRSGDSYDPGAFATTTGIYDTANRRLHGSLEDFAVTVDGRPYQREDRNFWGVTFASDDETFYVTMSSNKKIWLLRGRLSTRTLTAIGRDAECPSLSPDETRLTYKKRVGEHWRLHVLNLRTGHETPLAERAEVDDQAAWIDDASVAYGRSAGGRPSLFAVPADGTGAPRLLRRDATSPAIQR
ncbi:TolB family protein [Spirillospora sp. CA-294931]|uniref:TolB family protein n=1 Tax=Spirillospora sp. CA-294931 TaxID=3240042 RepID=UPI003D8F7112